MTGVDRRDFLTGAAALAAVAIPAVSRSREAAAGDPSLMNNVPDPALSA